MTTPKTTLRCAFEIPSSDDYFDCPQPEQIRLRLSGISVIIPTEQIKYLEADVNYTLLYTQNDEKYLSARTIKYYERLLDNNIFVRVHKSHIVNVTFIRNLNIYKKNGELSLEGGKQVEISRRKLKQIMENHEMGKFFNLKKNFS